MNMNQIAATIVIALALGTSACSKSEPEQQPVVPAGQPAAPAEQPMNHEGMDHSQMPMEHGDMQDDCDMQGMDMSTMSAEEHQAMMDKCQKNGAADDAHGGH